MTSDTGSRPLLTLPETAEYLHLTEESVRALVDARYLSAGADGPDGPRFPLVDLKAFLARNAENGAGNLFETEPESVDPQGLLDALDAKTDEMSRRALEIFMTVFPEASTWPITQHARFVEQARGRFEAILAVTSQGSEVDEALVGDLQDVGAAAARDGSPLPQLLVVLRISRDLVVQTAVELAEERGRSWGLALSLLLTRVLPAMDRLTDALAQGYWAAVMGREEERKARYEHVVEHASDGVYEVDLDAAICYANPSLAVILGLRSVSQLAGRPLTDTFVPLDPTASLDALLIDPEDGAQRLEVAVIRHDGVRRVLDIRSVARRRDGVVVGFQGVVRDVTATHDLEQDKNEFLALVTNDLRTPLTMILGLGATLESHSDELQVERIRRMGSSIRGQAERISRLADDLFEMSRLESNSLLLSPRVVPLARVVRSALDSVDSVDGVDDVKVDIAGELEVIADARRLEQVVANLVDNALQHGRAPVTVSSFVGEGGAVGLSVIDAGPGVLPTLVPTLFSRIRTLSRANRDRSRGSGLGLSLVQGLVEAMGGRVWYEAAPGGGASFRLTLPAPGGRPSGSST